jgi:hypothetical protein
MQSLLNIFRFIKYSLYFYFYNNDLKITNNLNPIHKFIIIVSPWNFSATPYFFIKLGALLNKNNNHVIFVLDNVPYNYIFKINLYILEKTLTLLRIPYQNIYNDKTYNPSHVDFEESKLYYDIAYENYMSLFRGHFNYTRFINFKNSYEKILPSVNKTLSNLISKNNDFSFIFGGGSFGTTGLFVKKLRECNANFFTIDSGFGIISCCHNGISARRENLNYSYFEKFSNQFSTNKIIEISDKIIQNRKNNTFNLTEYDAFQTTNYEGKSNFENYFVIYLNTIWDNAVFVEGTLKKDYLSSILLVIEFFLNNTQDNILVRIHPHERNWWGKSEFDYKSFFESVSIHFNKRLFIIEPTKKINSYDLLLNSKGSIVWSSTIGLESIFLGIPTIFIAKSYITNLKSIDKHLIKDLDQLNSFLNYPSAYLFSEKSNLDSRLLFILAQKYSDFASFFTPQSIDFLKWIKLSDEELFKDETLNLLFSSFYHNTQLTYEYFKKHKSDIS